MGTLYVLNSPAGHPDDLSLRARRILQEVLLVAADDLTDARGLLARCGTAPLLLPSTDRRAILTHLQSGDVALLVDGRFPVPGQASSQLIRSAIEQGQQVVPIPGPCLPVTALVISGLPSQSFVFLDQLPDQESQLYALFASVASQSRTLVALDDIRRISDVLSVVNDSLGRRPVVLVVSSEQGVEVAWRGSTDMHPDTFRHQGTCVLLIGGAQEPTDLWDEDRLQDEVQCLLEQGLGAKEISQRLAAASGWSRRKVYELVTAGRARQIRE